MKQFLMLLLAVAALPLWAEDDYEIRLARAATVGDRCVVSGRYAEQSTMVMKVQQQVMQTRSTQSTADYAFEQEVTAVGRKGVAVGLRITIKKMEAEILGRPASALKPGDVITVERKNPDDVNAQTRVNGQEATRPQATLILQIISLGAEGVPDDDEVLGPGRRVKIGETWKANPEKMAVQAGLKGMKGLKAEDCSGEVKLREVKDEDGVRCTNLESTVTLKGAGMPVPNAPPGMKVTKLEVEVKNTGILPVDPQRADFCTSNTAALTHLEAAGTKEQQGEKTDFQMIVDAKKAWTFQVRPLK